MTLAQALIAFFIAAGLLTMSPGVDTLMVLRTAATEGPRRAVLALAGILIGCLAWGVAVALGVGAMLAAAPMLFLALKWAGAAYLMWIGLGLLLRPRSGIATEMAGDRGGGALLWLKRGLLSNLLNPKMGLFYLSFLPQFVPQGYDPLRFMLLLTLLHLAMGMAWLGAIIAASAPLGRLLARPAFLRRLDRACGGMFLALGAKVALSR